MKILAVGAHPDDLEILCAGTLIRCVVRGDTVTMAHIARGDAGSFEHESDEIAVIRDAEARASAALVGAEYAALAISDGRVNGADEAQREAVTDLVRRTRPDVVITHAPNDYNPDHNEVSKLVFGASFTASLPNYGSRTPAHDSVPALYYMDTSAGVGFAPEQYVDVTDTIDAKLEACKKHASQLVWLRQHDNVDMVDQVRTVARFRGLQCGVPYAEGFITCRAWLREHPLRHLP